MRPSDPVTARFRRAPARHGAGRRAAWRRPARVPVTRSCADMSRSMERVAGKPAMRSRPGAPDRDRRSGRRLCLARRVEARSPGSTISATSRPAGSRSISAPRPAGSPRCCSSAARRGSCRRCRPRPAPPAACRTTRASIAREGLNARDLVAADIGEPVGAIVADVSFISLQARAAAGPGAGGAGRLGRVPGQAAVRGRARRASARAASSAMPARARGGRGDRRLARRRQPGWRVDGLIASPIAGGDGNREFLLGGAAVAETVEITALGHAGDGIAETAAGRVFVPFTLPGETVDDRTRAAAARGCFRHRPRQPPPRGAGLPAISAHAAAARSSTWQRARLSRLEARDLVEAASRSAASTPRSSRSCRSGRGAAAGPSSPRCGPRAGSFSASTDAAANEVVAIEECPVLVPAIATRLAVAPRDRSAWRCKPGRPARIAVLPPTTVSTSRINGPDGSAGERCRRSAGSAANRRWPG